MATSTHKATKRVSQGTIREASKHRRIVVQVGPGDVIGLRLERTRRVYFLEIETVYRMAQRRQAEADRAAKRAARGKGR